jgi:excisionase family DNA binding protein
MIVLDDEEYLTGEEAARQLGVKRATLYAYVSRGVLKSYRQGIKRQRLYRRADVEDLLRLSPGAAGEPEATALRRAPAEPIIVWSIPAAETWIRD